MIRTFFPTLILACLTVFAPMAAAQETQRVSWAPSYSGSCVNCQLAGRQLPFWNFTDGNYPGADLSGAMLHGAHAQRANFSNVSGAGVNFAQADLNGANFTNAKLIGANLSGADCSTGKLASADLSGADISGARFIAANLSRLIAANAFGPATDFSGAVANGAIFTGATLTGATFDGAVLPGANFAGADLSGASFRHTRLIAANLTDVTGFDSADFTGACTTMETRLPTGLYLPLCDDIHRFENK